MFRFACALIAVLVVGQVRHSCGYKWVALKENDPIPEHAVYCGYTIVGRARHFDMLLPADVYNSTYAVIKSCSKQWVKTKFEILVAPEGCEWRSLANYKDVPMNIVLVGSMEDNEPIYVARTNREYPQHLVRFYMSHKGTIDTFRNYDLYETDILVCKDLNVWVDTSARQIPNNTVFGQKSQEGYNTYVARLLKDCKLFPGQIIPEKGIAKANLSSAHPFEIVDENFNDYDLHETSEIRHPEMYVESEFCQVLVGERDEYRWVEASNGKIPDYAVVGAKNEDTVLLYVAKINNQNLGYIDHATASKNQMTYEVLVRNVN